MGSDTERLDFIRWVSLPICALCIEGMGQECHTVGCYFWMKDVPSDLEPYTIDRAIDAEEVPRG